MKMQDRWNRNNLLGDSASRVCKAILESSLEGRTCISGRQVISGSFIHSLPETEPKEMFQWAKIWVKSKKRWNSFRSCVAASVLLILFLNKSYADSGAILGCKGAAALTRVVLINNPLFSPTPRRSTASIPYQPQHNCGQRFQVFNLCTFMMCSSGSK